MRWGRVEVWWAMILYMIMIFTLYSKKLISYNRLLKSYFFLKFAENKNERFWQKTIPSSKELDLTPLEH